MTAHRPSARPTVNSTYHLMVLLAAAAGCAGEWTGSEAASEPELVQSALVGAWTSQDIGSVGATGNWSEASGTHTLNGAGGDIYGTADAFRFAYQDFTGDVTVTARIASLQNRNTWTKAVVAIRQDLTPGAKNVATVVSPTATNKYRQQVRNATNGSTTTASSSANSAIPSWIRLERAGSTFRSYHSTNGTSWTLIATATVSMTGTVRAGIGVTSHVSGTLAQAVFTNVSFTTPAPPTPPGAPAGVSATAGDARVTLAWTATGGATSYAVKRAPTTGGPYSTVQAGLTTTGFTDVGLTNGTPYFYVVTASNAVGESLPSSEVTATPALPPPPPAPTGVSATPGNAQITVAWATTAGATSYSVKRGAAPGGPYDVVQAGITGTSFTATGLSNGTPYHFVVTASNSGGEGPASGEVSTTPVDAVVAISVECQRWQTAARTRVYPASAAELNAALAAATPGTMIELRAGVTYTASGTPQRFTASGRNGTSADKIYLCGPRTAVLMSSMQTSPADDGGTSTNYVLWLNNSNWWVIDGFTVRTSNKGVILDGSSNNTVRYLHVSDLGEEGIHVRKSSSNNVIEFNTVEDTGKRVPGFGEAIYVGTAAGNWVKVMGTLTPDRSDNNIIRNNTTRSRSEGVDIKEGTTGGRIENNTIYGTFLAGASETSADSCMELKGKGWTIRSNHCETTLADGLQVKNQSGACQTAGTTCPDSGTGNILELNTTNMRTPSGGTATGYSIHVGGSATGNTVRCNNTHTNKAASYKTNVTCVN